MSCPFKQNPSSSLLGEPYQGVHEARIGNYALNDIIGTFAIAGVTSYATNSSYVKNLLLWFVLAEVSHIAFGVHTQLLIDLGIYNNDDELSQSSLIEKE